MRTLRRPASPLIALPVLVASLALAACRPASTAVADSSPASGPAAAASTPTTMTAVPSTPVGTDPGHAGQGTRLAPRSGDALAAFAEGCFWGSEDTFRHVDGVVATAVGYTGGHTANPTYEDVCTHTTGHAETVLVEYDPSKVSFEKLLRVFWDSHDPTTPNRQGPDIGDQYRSAIFTFSPDQDRAARSSMSDEQKRYKEKITTEIKPIGAFYKAEDYHQQYDEKTGRHSCPLPHRATNGT